MKKIIQITMVIAMLNISFLEKLIATEKPRIWHRTDGNTTIEQTENGETTYITIPTSEYELQKNIDDTIELIKEHPKIAIGAIVILGILYIANELIADSSNHESPTVKPQTEVIDSLSQTEVIDSNLSLAKEYHSNRDYKNAFSHYYIAADAGNSEAQYKIAIFYSRGLGIPKDSTKAVYWCELAATQGIKNAQYDLARYYENGWGVDKNIDRAIYWYEQAAQQGHKKAQNALKKLKESWIEESWVDEIDMITEESYYN